MKLVEIPVRHEQPDLEEEFENFYTREQLIHFLQCAEKENNYKAFTLFRLLAFSGMRKGEALALTWRDINFEAKEIRINKALSRGKDSRLYVKNTKNKKNRTIKMDDKTMEFLRIWKEQQFKDYTIIGFDTLTKKQLVFSNEYNEHLQPTKTRKWLEHILNKYNLDKITTHGLRHTHCSLLFEAGATIPEVQDRLGHDDVQTTMNIYTHVSKKAKENAIQKFSDYLNDDNN
nr:site-specific integrase [Lysinibacillus composti]